MGYKMNGSPMHYGTSKHKSALKQVSDDKKTEKTEKTEETEKTETYAKIIKDHNMTKDEKGHWRDKDGRTPNSIYQGIKHGQRSYKLPASDSTTNR